jgi:hypothetical protein
MKQVLIGNFVERLFYFTDLSIRKLIIPKIIRNKRIKLKN